MRLSVCSSFNFECLSLWEPFVHIKCKWKIAFEFLSKFYQRIVRNKVIFFRSGAFRLTRFTQCKREEKKTSKPKINLKEIKIETNRNFGIWWNVRCWLFSWFFLILFSFVFICIIRQQPSLQMEHNSCDTLNLMITIYFYIISGTTWTLNMNIFYFGIGKSQSRRDKMECATVSHYSKEKQANKTKHAACLTDAVSFNSRKSFNVRHVVTCKLLAESWKSKTFDCHTI